MDSHFRTKFNNEVIENRIREFGYWSEIQSKEVDTAFEVYLLGPYIQKLAPLDVALVFRLIGQGGSLGVGIEAHEKWEVLEYLKKNYTLEDIGSGKAYQEYKRFAHAEALLKEFRLYQFLYKKLFRGHSPVMKAFFFIYPLLKLSAEDIDKVKVTVEIMDQFGISQFGEYENIVRSEKCSEDDIEKCIRFFEKTGYDYGEQRDLFLKRGLEFLKKIG